MHPHHAKASRFRLGSLAVVSLLGVAMALLPAEEQAVPVEVTTALRSNEVVESVSLTGTVSSQRRARLSARTMGLIEEVAVDAGDRVQEGDTLLQMDARLAEMELELVLAQIETAEIQLKDAHRRFNEVRELISDGAYAKTEAGTLEAAVAVSGAELRVLRVREQQARERIERHRLIAPFSGVIAQKATEAGEWVDTGAMVLELVETDTLWFDLQAAQEFVAAVRRADRAELRLDTYPDHKLEAKVDVVVPVKDPVSRTFLTRLTFADEQGLASPGMSGRATLYFRPGDDSTTFVPRDAVVRRADGTATVWVVTGTGARASVRPVSIRTAANLGESVEVTEGLQGGERIVVRGNEGLTENQTVVIREYAPREESMLR